MNKKKASTVYFVISLILLFALLGLIFYLSAQTADTSSETSGGIIELIEKLFKITLKQELIRTLAHFSEYTLLGFLMSNAFFAKSSKKHTLVSFALSCIYAVSDETHQLFVAGRAFQISDLAVDFCGSLLGCMIFGLLIYIINTLKNKKLKKQKTEKELC